MEGANSQSLLSHQAAPTLLGVSVCLTTSFVEQLFVVHLLCLLCV